MQDPQPFEPVAGARFEQQRVDGEDWIVMPAPRNWFAIPFLAVWLTFWTSGGFAAGGELLNGGFQPFLAVWLVFWALGMFFAVSCLSWQIRGVAGITVSENALVFRWSMPLISGTKRYDLREVRNLRGGATMWLVGKGIFYMSVPPFFPVIRGGLRFDYGARTVTILNDLDETEGNAVARWVEARMAGG